MKVWLCTHVQHAARKLQEIRDSLLQCNAYGRGTKDVQESMCNNIVRRLEVHLCILVLIEVCDSYIGALAGKCQGHCATYPTVSSSNQRFLQTKDTHGIQMPSIHRFP